MQRAAIAAGRNLRIRLASLRQGMLPRQCDDAMQLRIEALQATKIDLRQPL